ncbi:MAG TPA: hypothetical protein VJP77_04225 [Planctomycetota bacterium]|nr:hypothetical protein [Planctomycetota bacterium]
MKVAILTAAAVVLTWVAVTAVTWLCFREKAPGIGDSFGSVNALFSGLALAGVILALRMQSTELTLQRKELGQTRKELAGQREQLEAQVAAMSQQNYESHLFQLIELRSRVVDRVKIKPTSSVQGHAAIAAMVGEVKTHDQWNYLGPVYSERLGAYYRATEAVLEKLLESPDAKYRRLFKSLLPGSELRILTLESECEPGSRLATLVRECLLL